MRVRGPATVLAAALLCACQAGLAPAPAECEVEVLPGACPGPPLPPGSHCDTDDS